MKILEIERPAQENSSCYGSCSGFISSNYVILYWQNCFLESILAVRDRILRLKDCISCLRDCILTFREGK